MKCKICSKEVTSRNFWRHLKHEHKMTSKEYYDKYLKKPGEGICPICGKPTKFSKLTRGYNETCSRECAIKNPNRVKKIKETCLKKYGVENVYLIPEIKEKAQKNSHTEEAINKMLITKKEKYGYSAPWEDEEIHEKALKNGHTRERNEQRVITFLNTLDKFEKENNCTRISKLIKKYGQGWLKIKDEVTILRDGQYSYVVNNDIYKIIDYFNTNFGNISYKEKQVLKYIKSIYNSTIIENTKQVITPLELDIYIPDKKLAVEFNGTYWHSFPRNENRKYHLEKSKLCEEKGIRLIHIYEWELEEPYWSKIKMMLNQALGNNPTIYARNCIIKEISNKEAKELNEQVHLQGHRNAKVSYGLFYEDQLVQLMSFSKTRYNRNLKGDNDWEIIRGCPGSNISVVGGVSKLFKHFIKTHNPDKVFSYCDFNKFDGISYEKLGMNFIGYTGPDKTWIINGEPVKRNPKKYKELKEKAEGIMWGSGSKKYEYKI